MLSVLLVVLVAAYALLLFILTFFADINSVDSLRFSAVFMLLAAVVTFGVLMFFGSGTLLDPIEEDEPIATPTEVQTASADLPSSPAVCTSCGQDNPAGANFCYACGVSFAPESAKDEELVEPASITKAELLQRLHDGGEDALKRLRDMPEDSFEGGRYENGWNARQILAHIASIEWTYPRLIDRARGGEAPQPPESSSVNPAESSDRILSYNDRQVEKRAEYTIGQLLDELETNRAATITAVEAADDDLFTRPVTSAGGVQGTLAEVLDYVAVQHVATHVNDIASN